MAPWALFFVFIFSFIGYLYGKVLLNGALLKSAKMELENKVKKRTKALLHANQVLWAEILQRKKAEKELIERINLAELSAEIGAALVRHDNLTAQLQHCSECIVKHLDAAFARIWILNKDRNVLELKASAGMYTRTDGDHSVKKMGELKIGIIAEQKKPHLTNTVIGDPMISDQKWARQEGIVSFAGYPLVLSDKVVGVMAMFSKKPLHETVLHALKSISDSIALGIEQKKAEDQIYFLAYYDNLTRLPNRYFFTRLLEQSLEYAQRHDQTYAIMLIDLDNFTRINDSFGHHTGDDLLKKVSSRLLQTLRSSDCVARISGHEDPVARMGGDEFIVLLQHGKDGLQITHVARRIRDELSLPYELVGREIFITISAGIALYPGDGGNGEDLITNAEAALNHAKKKGQNNFALYSKSMNERAIDLLALETDLRRAIEKQEFVLYYQPKIDVSTNKVVGSEALVRWKTAEGKMISPGEFIPLAETTGLIVPIGKRVVQMACRQNEIWHRNHGQKISVAINVSGLQFGQKTFVHDMLTIISKTDLDPRYVIHNQCGDRYE